MKKLFQSITGALLFGLLVIAPPIGAFADETMSEAAFKKLLVANSPWSLEWENGSYDGTFKMGFSFEKKDTFAGKFFDNSGGKEGGVWKDIKFHDNKCVSFISSTTETEYDQCLKKDGTLKGSQWYGSSEGTVIAHPAKR